MTYLNLINSVLRRLREDTVADLSDSYTLLVGDFVNEAKRLVEEAHDWNALWTETQFNSVADQADYTLTGLGLDFTPESVWDMTTLTELSPRNRHWLRKRDIGSPDASLPGYYVWNGVDSSGDAIITLFNKPDSILAMEVHGYVRTMDFTLVADATPVPHRPMIDYAIALALRERGEDDSQTSLEAFGKAQRSLSDAIARDANFNPNQYDCNVN